ncbi:MAG: phosphoribosyltransferase [Paraglaciecola sp.]|uniref:phosphoribosyltransferase n=1 Tax=Paraglaciecola sp. TaxID=1920173 RepID=UPI00329A1E45
MGFIVNQTGLVSVVHSHNSFGDTRVSSNPTSAKTKCLNSPMNVHSLLLRGKNRSPKRAIGDNCPLIYALKKKEQLRTSYQSFKPLVDSLNQIVDKFFVQQCALGITYNEVITMPSSHKISLILGKRIATKFNASLNHGLFLKTTNAQVRQQIFGNFTAIPHGARTNIIDAVSKAELENREFSLSDVKTEYRNYVSPLTMNSTFNNTQSSILLVDDLFATGKTLVTAKDLLLSHGCSINNIEALCLFSPLNGRIR